MRAVQQLKYFIFALFTLASCMKNDVYNPDSKPDNGKLTDLIIPENFKWSTTQQVAINVSVDNRTEHTYTLLIYPQGYTDSTLPIATGTVSSSSPYNGTITLPASDTLVSIIHTLRYNDGERSYLQYTAPIENGKVNAKFSTVSSESKQTRSLAVTTRGIDEEFNNATELTNNIKNLSKGIYKVSVGNTYTLPKKNINTGGELKIYVAGTLVVPEGGVLNNNNGENESEIIILGEKHLGKDQTGTLMCSGDFTLNNGFEIENHGVINIKGTFKIHNGSDVDTYGCVYADKLELNGNGSKGNGKGEDEDEDENDVDYDIKQGGSTIVNDMSMQKASVEMEAGTYLQVKNKLTLKKECEIEGPESKQKAYAVVEVGTVSIDGDGSVKPEREIKERVFVVCDQLLKAPEGVSVSDGAVWSNTNEAKENNITTPASHCFSGFNPDGNDSGVDPEPEEIKTSPGLYSYAFEDQWPNLGDYDMNDLVLEANPHIYSKNNIVTKVVFEGRITALGASNKIAAAVQWDEIPSNAISGINYSEESTAFTESLFSLNANKTESGQKYAVIPLFDNGHTLCGSSATSLLGTSAGSHLSKSFTITITMATNSNISTTSLELEKWNYFITCNATNGKRMEIHMIDKKPTDLFDNNRIGGVAQLANDPFKTKDNFCWAMRIPGSFNFPLERNDIRQSFENFDSWITDPSYKWYEKPKEGMTRSVNNDL